MVNGVHSDTTDNWESLSESFEFVEKHTCLHNRFFISTSTCDNTDGSSAGSRNSFSGSRRKSYSSSASIIRVSDYGGIGACASWIRALISDCGFNIANSCTLSNLIDWENITNWHGCFSSAKDVLAWVGSFCCKEILGSVFISIRISEINFQHRGTSSGFVENSSNHTLNVSLSLSEIEVSISWGSNSFWFGSSINSFGFTLSLT